MRNKCRRCADCRGRRHHWVEHCVDGESDFTCKHCDATAELCMDCMGDGEYVGVNQVSRTCRACNGEGVITSKGIVTE